MGKGKTRTSSKSAYTDTTNKCINNTTFMPDRVLHYETQKEKHKKNSFHNILETAIKI